MSGIMPFSGGIINKIDKASVVSLLVFSCVVHFSMALATFFLIAFFTLGSIKVIGGGKSFWAPLSPPELGVLVYIGWIMVSSIFTTDPISNLVAIRSRYQVLLFFFIPRTIGNEKHIKWIVSGFIAGAFVSAFLGLYQISFTGVLSYGRPSGAMGNPLSYAETLVLALAILVPKITKSLDVKNALAVFSSGIIASGVVVALCRGPWLALMSILLGFEWLRRKRIWVSLTLFLLISLALGGSRSTYVAERYYSIFNLKNNSNLERVNIWRVAIKMATEKPIVGFGIANVKKGYETTKSKLRIGGPAYGEMHNIFLQALVSHGIPGFFFFIRMFWTILRSLRLDFRDPLAEGAILSTIAFLVCGLTESVFNDSEVVMGLFLILGLWAAKAQCQKIINQVSDGASNPAGGGVSST